MRDLTRDGCHHAEMGWDQMPAEEEQWTAVDGDWGPTPDWAAADTEPATIR